MCVQYLRVRILLGGFFHRHHPPRVPLLPRRISRRCLLRGKASTTSGAFCSNVTSTGVPAGFITSMTVVNGAASSVLVNSVGATTYFGAVPTSLSNSTHSSGASRLVVGFEGMLAVAGGVAMLI